MLKWFKKFKAKYIDTATMWDVALISQVWITPYLLGFSPVSCLTSSLSCVGYFMLKRPATSYLPGYETCTTLRHHVNNVASTLNVPKPKIVGYLFEEKNRHVARSIALPEEEYGIFLGWDYKEADQDEIIPIIKHELGHIKHHDLQWRPVAHDMLRYNFVSSTMLMMAMGLKNAISLRHVVAYLGSNLGAFLFNQAASRTREYRADRCAAMNQEGVVDDIAAKALIRVLNKQLNKTKQSVYSTHEGHHEQANHASDITKALLEPNGSLTHRFVKMTLPLLFDTPLQQSRIDAVQASIPKR